MKKQIISMLVILSTIGVGYGLTVDQSIENAISYIKKMIFTVDGTENGEVKVVIDGTNGNITMGGTLDIQEGAIKDGTVVTNDLKDGAVTNLKIANGAITSDKIADGSIKAEDIDPNIDLGGGVFQEVGTNAVYTGGDVGIGTDSPESKLHIVEGEITSDSVTTKDGLTITQVNNIGSKIELGIDKLKNAGLEMKAPVGYIDFSDNIEDDYQTRISYNRGKYGTGKFVITNKTGVILDTDFVGIGTTDPQAKLDVNGNLEAKTDYGDKIGLGGDDYADDLEVYIKAPEERNQVVFWNRTINKRADIKAKQGWFLSGVYTKGADIDYKTLEGQDIEFGHIDEDGNIISRDMIISSGGNVGIGTTTPQSKLDINGSVIIRGKYSVYRDGGTTIYMIDLNGNKYSLDINGLDDGDWHCSAGNKICYNSHGSSDDAELQFNITDSPSISCTLLHNEDDYASRSKGLYSATDGGNNCAVYTNNGTCFKVGKSGATTSPFHSYTSYKIICF